MISSKHGHTLYQSFGQTKNKIKILGLQVHIILKDARFSWYLPRIWQILVNFPLIQFPLTMISDIAVHEQTQLYLYPCIICIDIHHR